MRRNENNAESKWIKAHIHCAVVFSVLYDTLSLAMSHESLHIMSISIGMAFGDSGLHSRYKLRIDGMVLRVQSNAAILLLSYRYAYGFYYTVLNLLNSTPYIQLKV